MGQKSLNEKRASRRWWSAIASFAVLLGVNEGVRATTLRQWQFDPNTNQLELILDRAIAPSYYLESTPPRIIIELPEVEFNGAIGEQRYSGAVRRISSTPLGTTGTRIIVELSPDIPLSPQQVQLLKFDRDSGTNRWLFYPSIISASSPPPIPSASPPTNPAPATVRVPPLAPTGTPQPAPSPPIAPPTAPATRGPSTPAIEFGQPLPKSSSKSSI